jgi:DNA topoisomerase I
MKLVIVESPGKIKAISSYLGSDYIVMASIGHIRLLDKKGKYNLGVDVENNFEPSYKNDPDKKDVIKKLKDTAKNAEIIYLASDNDLEGESISWHLQEILGVAKSKLKRITFNEITKKAIEEAIKKPRSIDMQKVDAQETRRLLDRIVGFRLSGLALSKLNAKSAGRVQSAALKILVDKELEIKAFIPETYFEIFLPFTKGKKEFKAKYAGTEKKKLSSLAKQAEADKVVNECKTGEYDVSSIEQKDRVVKSKPPYTTSTFQQEVSSRLGYGSKKAMKVAQSLYEQGLITYMRTDSIRLSDDFIAEAKKLILESYGKEYYTGKINGTNSDSSQNAHEGIRPTHLDSKPDDLKAKLESDEFKVYKLIYDRSVAALMSDATIKDTTVSIKNNGHIFKIKGQEIVFEGFYKAYREVNEDDESEQVLPKFTQDEKIKDKPLEVLKKETQPPKRYTEAGLVKVLEKLGIGRPSTYASIMDTLTGRDYTEKKDKTLIPTEKGIEVIQMLSKYFNDSILDSKYTAELEKTLDSIADGKSVKLTELQKFYKDFEPLVLKAFREFENGREKPVMTDKVCPKCSANLLIRTGKFGQFYACSKYPKCKHTEPFLDPTKPAPEKPVVEQPKVLHTCPVCNKGQLIRRIASKGKSAGSSFYACNQYPKCKTTFTEQEYAEKFLGVQNGFSDVSTDTED